ncbi:hypothetical protein L6248_02545 [Candidatus Parcubacteria bacterium]|nr:hypothetical protein [Candidatus Parcubacteria bacterium]
MKKMKRFIGIAAIICAFVCCMVMPAWAESYVYGGSSQYMGAVVYGPDYSYQTQYTEGSAYINGVVVDSDMWGYSSLYAGRGIASADTGSSTHYMVVNNGEDVEGGAYSSASTSTHGDAYASASSNGWQNITIP